MLSQTYNFYKKISLTNEAILPVSMTDLAGKRCKQAVSLRPLDVGSSRVVAYRPQTNSLLYRVYLRRGEV
jgi:hypothetical protein